MEINAEAYLRYRHGEAITTGWERLEIVVKFKEGKKLLKTKIIKTLATTYNIKHGNDPYCSYGNYLEDVKRKITNKDYLHMAVETIVKEHIVNKENNTNEGKKKTDIINLVSNMEKIKVKVKL